METQKSITGIWVADESSATCFLISSGFVGQLAEGTVFTS